MRRLTKFVCALLLGTSLGLAQAADLPIVRKGPELEIQKDHAQTLLAQMDSELLHARWKQFLNVYSALRPPSDPIYPLQHLIALHRWRADKGAIETPTEAELSSFWEKKRGYVLNHVQSIFNTYLPNPTSSSHETPDAIVQYLNLHGDRLRTDSALAIAAANFIELIPQDELTDLTDWERSILAPDRDYLENGLYTLRGDDERSYRVKADGDVFEIVHFPPFKDQAVKGWVHSLRERLGISADAIPARTLNPHFHYSRTFDQALPKKELFALLQELRVLTAIVTINESETTGLAKPARPFYRGYNSANMGWLRNDPDVSSIRAGNVRLVLPDVGGGIHELRMEFRSLGNLKWEKVFSFMDAIEEAFQAGDLSAVRRTIRKIIAARFVQSDLSKLTQAIEQSRAHLVASEYLSPIDDYLDFFRDQISRALAENYGAQQAQRWLDEKFPATLYSPCQTRFVDQHSILDVDLLEEW